VLGLRIGDGVRIGESHDTTHTPGYAPALSASHGMSFDPNAGMYATMTSGGSGESPLVFPNVVVGTTTATDTAPAGKTCTANQAITNWRVDANTFTWVDFTCQ